MNGHVDEGSDQILDLKRCWTRQHGRLLEALAHKRKVPESQEGRGESSFFFIRRIRPSIYPSPKNDIRNFKYEGHLIKNETFSIVQ